MENRTRKARFRTLTSAEKREKVFVCVKEEKKKNEKNAKIF
jgi:hypothetical protein